MSDQEHSSSQLSALFDGELPTQQAEMVIRRALREPGLRTSWERYALIGACVRNEPLCATVSIADRVQARLAAERELNVTALPRRSAATAAASRMPLFARGALGGAIAAGVAVLSIFLVRNLAPEGAGSGPMQVADAEPVIGAEQLDAPGYTTPGVNAPVQRRMLDASLGHYLVAHSEEAASALRSSFDLAQGGMQLTEDQVSALR